MRLLKFIIFLFFSTIILIDICFCQDVNIHGFISQGFLQSDLGNFMAETEKGTLDFNECSINFSKELNSNLHMGVQLLSRDFGDYDNNIINVDWAFADYRWRDFFGFRIGQVKIPFGLYNEIRDVDMLRSSVLLPTSVYSESWRDSFTSIRGGGLYGNYVFKFIGDIGYQLIYGQSKIPVDGGIAQTLMNRGEIKINQIDAGKLFGGMITWVPEFDKLTFGISYLNSSIDFYNQTTNNHNWGDFRLAIDMNHQLPDQLNTTVNSKINNNEISQNITNSFINNLVPDYIQSLNATWPKNLHSQLIRSNFLLYSFKYQSDKLTLSAEYMDIRLNSETNLQENNYLLDKYIIHRIGYYYNLSYRFTDWLELGCYYSITYGNDDDKQGTYFLSLNEKDSYKYSVQERYSNSSIQIQQAFKYATNQVLSQMDPNIQLTDDDVKNIKLIPNYTLERITYHDYSRWLKEFAVSARFDINENWIFKIEGHFMDGNDYMDLTENNGDIGQKRFLFASKVTYSF